MPSSLLSGEPTFPIKASPTVEELVCCRSNENRRAPGFSLKVSTTKSEINVAKHATAKSILNIYYSYMGRVIVVKSLGPE